MEEMILKEREVREQIVEITKNSGLPALILKPIFEDFLNQLKIIKEQQYKLAKQNKEKQQKENEDKKLKEAKK